MSNRRPPRRPPGPEDAPQRPIRRQSPVPTIVAVAVSLLLLILAIVLYSRSDLNRGDDAEKADRTRTTKAEKLAREKLRALVNEKDPLDEDIAKLITAFREHDATNLRVFIDQRAVHDYLAAKRKSERRWKDLRLSETLNYYDQLLQEPVFDSRWKLATVGEWRREPATEQGYIDHQVLIVPRRFPSGEEDEVRFLLRLESNGRARIRGASVKVTKTASAPLAAVQDDLVVPDAIEKKAGFKSLDTSLKGAELPASKRSGGIDVKGRPMGSVEKVPPIEGTSSLIASKIDTFINTLLDPDETRAAQAAIDELALIGKPAIPPLLNRLVGRDLNNPDDVFACHQAIQGLRTITGQRFGFEPQVGTKILTAAAASEQADALKRWFGWWKMNAKTFEPSLTEQQKKEIRRRQRRAERNRNS